ncbi:hypothetical protein D0865_09726 [Hortaea werneckii]|uniref:Peptidase C15, pyroglutamyl peptidase I-like protein n=1 Tax=Hortaea werneckii TaxID=91943 RepID=A0A3M7C0Z9_HORWE|nr:hypothetical protein D0865_09726 [Hortaea werneckii]
MTNQDPRRPSNGAEGSRPYTVLVTGFGPFQQKYPVNPSFEIARTLPEFVPRSTPAVCYEEAWALIPPLLESYYGTIDLVLHIGMASGRTFYTAERFAHRDNYSQHTDIDGHVPKVEDVLYQYPDCPVMMESSLSYDDLLQRWQSTVSHAAEGSALYGADCRSSEDAGHYLCDYTYFNSLAWFGRRHKQLEDGKPTDRPVMFLHVPAESDEKVLDTGRAVALALIQSMVDVLSGSS